MDSEIMESVLSEILEEQKASLQATKELATSMKELACKVEDFIQKADHQKVAAPPSDTKVMQAIITSGIQQIQQTVETQPKPVIRQFRFLLFPELYADQYYRIVFGRLLFWMMIFTIATYLYVLGKQSIEGNIQLKTKQLETNQYKKAWHYLYEHDKKLKSKMDSAWVKSWAW